MSELDKPDLPEPEKIPPGGDVPPIPPKAEGEPSMNGAGNSHVGSGIQIDQEKLIEWMKATDKQIKMLTVGNVILCGTCLFLLFITAKPKPSV